MNYLMCRELHRDCSLYFTEGILKNPVKRNYQYEYAVRLKNKNIWLYHDKHRIVKRNIASLTELLKKRNYSCDTIHSDMNYQTRKKIMESFRNHDLQILCATDVASRGIDIPSVDTVILYDISDTEEQLIHRIGRCSRDGRKANAYLLITKNDHRYSYDRLFPKVIKENHR